MTNSSVNQVLVTKGNQALAGANTTAKDLLPGQLGFFDADSRLAITNAATANKANKILIAVGVDTNGDTTTDRIKYQAGESILMQYKGTHKVVYTPASAQRVQKYRISALKANCDTEYILKMTFDGPAIAEFSNTSMAKKNYTVRTSCCSDCATGCYQGSCVELAVKLRDELNMDVEKLFSAVLTDPSAANAVVTDVATWVANPANADKCLDVDITGNVKSIAAKCGFNFNYEKVRDIVFTPYLSSGFGCSGTVTETQVYAAETGNSYDLKFMEQVNAGWKNGSSAYRMYESGVQKGIESLIENVKYDTLWMTYPYFIEAGERKANDLQTLLAIPETDTVTRNAVAALLALIYPNMDSLVDDTAAASTTPTVVEAAISNEDTDGIA